MKVWIDGEIVEGHEARISVTDHGLLYGDGVFEGMRIIGRGVFRLDRHLKRLEDSARALALALPDRMTLREIVLETARAFGADEAYVRLLVTRGEGPLGVDPTQCTTPRILCMVTHLNLYSDEKRREGLALVTASVRRPRADVLDPRIKSLNYLNSVMAKLQARQAGADEALILNDEGQVAEAAVANLFCVRDGVVLTPPASDGALEGITRGAILELAEARGVPAREKTLGRMDLLAADEVFMTGSGAGIIAIRSLDGRDLAGKPPGPITQMLTQAYYENAIRDVTPFT